MRSEFESSLNGQSEQGWLYSFECSGDEFSAAAAPMRWPELSHIDPPHSIAVSALAEQGSDHQDQGDGLAASAAHPHKECHV